MRILLTGGAGFIGLHLWRDLLARKHDVRVLDSLRTDVHSSEQPKATPGDMIVGDVRDRETVETALHGIDAVVHLAAKVGLGVDVGDYPDYASTNDVGMAQLLSCMTRKQVRRLTLASSMVVYGEGLGRCEEHGLVRPGVRTAQALEQKRFEPPCPHCGRALGDALVDEDAPLDPRNAYATSKLSQEYYANNWARATQSSAASLRYHNVYGPGMPDNTPYAGVAAIFASKLRRGEAPMVFEDGGQRRDFVHVRDVAAATASVCENVSEGVCAFNVGSGIPRTVGQMAQSLSSALGGPAPVVSGAFRLGDVRHITADSSRLRREMSWSPAMEFDQGMAEFGRG